MSHPDVVYVEPGHFYCVVPAELVDGEPTLCAGVRFKRVEDGACALELLTDEDIERLTGPEA